MMSKIKKYGIYKKSLSILCIIILLLSCVPFTVITFAPTVSAAGQDDEVVVVSLGDSFSSGEGIEKFYGQDADIYTRTQDPDWLAHRSENSWPGLLKFEGLNGTLANHKDKNWFFFATSGAETQHMENDFKKEFALYEGIGFDGIHYYEDYEYVDAQLDSLREVLRTKKEIDYVTLTLGGNDANFTGVITEAVSSSLTLDPNKTAHMLNNIWAEFYKENGIRDKLREAYKKIYEASGHATIIVAGYPKLIDKNGGILFSPEVASLVNDSVSRFNNEIEALVNSCKADGMRICFVSVEEAFEGKEAYTKNAYLNNIKIGPRDQELNEKNLIKPSAYSMHPNKDGAAAYAECVQKKIDDIEKDGGKSEWPMMSGSDERDVVLVLDTSGSMAGTPLNETKKAAERFVDTIMNVDASVGIVTYDSSAMKVSDFNKNHTYLRNTLESLNSGGQTNIEDGLRIAESMLDSSTAKKKIIVLMSDGEPNTGKTGDSLIQYANEIKSKGIYIYTLGFFGELGNKREAQRLMEAIASSGCHYEVDNAENLVYFFSDIADQIQGKKYIYIRIACPVDVEVKYGGETLSSKNNYESQRTDFGTLTFEENPEERDDDADNRIKILRLEEGAEYDIHIEGNGKGKMNYTIGFMDDEGQYSDMREFEKIKITKDTEIDTVAARTDTTVLKVDEDGDGRYDLTYKATENSEGKLVDYSYLYYIGGAVAAIIILVILVLIIKSKIAKRKAASKEKHKYVPPVIPAKEAPVAVPKPTQTAAYKPAPTVATKPSPIAEAPKPAPVKNTSDEGGIKFCPKCGQKATGKTFCPYCGEKFNNK